MVRKRHCDISEALANVFALKPEPGGPIWPIWPIGVGAPGFGRSEHIVVTPLVIICDPSKSNCRSHDITRQQTGIFTIQATAVKKVIGIKLSILTRLANIDIIAKESSMALYEGRTILPLCYLYCAIIVNSYIFIYYPDNLCCLMP